MKANFLIVGVIAFSFGMAFGLAMAPKPPKPPEDCVAVLPTERDTALKAIWPDQKERYHEVTFSGHDRTEVRLFRNGEPKADFRFIYRRDSTRLQAVSLSFEGELDRPTTEDLIHVVKALGHSDPQALADEVAKVWGRGESLGESSANVGRFSITVTNSKGKTYISIRPSDNRVHWFYMAPPDIITSPPKSL